MSRPRSRTTERRLRELVDAALSVFCRQGYERSQMADVAKAMGVVPGTIYLYVESKEALFDLVIRHTASESPDWLDQIEIPVRTPEPGTTLGFLREILDRRGQWPVLESALSQSSSQDIRAELDGVLREQYRLMARHRAGLVLLMKSALEFPGLLEVFVLGLRKRLLDTLGLYLRSRIQSEQVRPVSDVGATAAVVTQTIVWANLQRPFDPGLKPFSEQTIEDATVDLLISGLLNPTPIA